MTTLEEAFEQFKQLPDWDKYPMPEVFYEHFKVPKPKTGLSIMEALTYVPPPSVSLNKNGRVEIREPAPGGVREVQQLEAPPVEVKKVNEETGELEDYPEPPKQARITLEDFHLPTLGDSDKSAELLKLNDYLASMKAVIDRTSSDKQQDSDQMK